jgi:hypothetical protein
VAHSLLVTHPVEMHGRSELSGDVAHHRKVPLFADTGHRKDGELERFGDVREVVRATGEPDCRLADMANTLTRLGPAGV